MLKRIAFVMVIAAAVALLVPSVAMANFAIHGNYVQDTDACAGCHRAHTSISSVTWSDNHDPNIQHDALLTSSATLMYEFCYACHGDGAQGADTNVQTGVYEGTLYGTTGARPQRWRFRQPRQHADHEHAHDEGLLVGRVRWWLLRPGQDWC